MRTINPILIDLPIPIETPRLLVRPPKIGDGAMLNAAVLESFDLLNKFMLWANEKPSLGGILRFVSQGATLDKFRLEIFQ